MAQRQSTLAWDAQTILSKMAEEPTSYEQNNVDPGSGKTLANYYQSTQIGDPTFEEFAISCGQNSSAGESSSGKTLRTTVQQIANYSGPPAIEKFESGDAWNFTLDLYKLEASYESKLRDGEKIPCDIQFQKWEAVYSYDGEGEGGGEEGEEEAAEPTVFHVVVSYSKIFQVSKQIESDKLPEGKTVEMRPYCWIKVKKPRHKILVNGMDLARCGSWLQSLEIGSSGDLLRREEEELSAPPIPLEFVPNTLVKMTVKKDEIGFQRFVLGTGLREDDIEKTHRLLEGESSWTWDPTSETLQFYMPNQPVNILVEASNPPENFEQRFNLDVITKPFGVGKIVEVSYLDYEVYPRDTFAVQEPAFQLSAGALDLGESQKAVFSHWIGKAGDNCGNCNLTSMDPNPVLDFDPSQHWHDVKLTAVFNVEQKKPKDETKERHLSVYIWHEHTGDMMFQLGTNSLMFTHDGYLVCK